MMWNPLENFHVNIAKILVIYVDEFLPSIQVLYEEDFIIEFAGNHTAQITQTKIRDFITKDVHIDVEIVVIITE